MLRPSVHPSFWSSCRNAAMRACASGSVSLTPVSTPIRRIRSGCCALLDRRTGRGASGIGFLGDEGKFVSNGRNRVSRIRDTGVLTARIVFSKGESRLRFHGFALERPEVRATKAIVEDLTYDSRTRRFRFALVARPATSPIVILKTSAHSKAGGPSDVRASIERTSGRLTPRSLLPRQGRANRHKFSFRHGYQERAFGWCHPVST